MMPSTKSVSKKNAIRKKQEQHHPYLPIYQKDTKQNIFSAILFNTKHNNKRYLFVKKVYNKEKNNIFATLKKYPMKRYILLISLIATILTSCTPTKEMTYFHDLAQTADIVQTIPDSIKNFESVIEPDDMLTISVTALDPNAVAIFNLPLQSYLAPGVTELMTTPALQTFMVNSEGYIDYPVLGALKVSGMTRDELTNYLKKEISNYVEDPIVSVQCTNYKFTILGEVARPGSYEFGSERITLLDALGKAGDMTIYGNHTNVLLIREVEGVRSFHRIDLTQPDIFTSPYYYLQRNDIVYVEPNKARQGAARYSQENQYLISVVSAVTSAASVIVSLCIALFVR